MRTLKLIALLAVAATFTLGLMAGTAHDKSRAGTYLGPDTKLGNGVVRAWVQLDRKGNPKSVGVTLTEEALTGLPAPHGDHGPEYVLPLPAEAAQTPFDHVGFHWNPQGHEPPEIYGLPHFDVHFYMIPVEEKLAISPEDPAFKEKAAREADPAFLPEGYVSTVEPVPQMGVHWIDPTSPEFNGKAFTKTFIYGYYDAKLIFVEPMMTKAFLESKPKFSESLKLPAAYARPGFYPTRYSIRHDAANKEYRITLEGFKKR